MKFLGEPRSGSQAGTTSSRNRFGQYTRSRATPVNPSSIPQSTARAALGLNAAGWRALTDAQRAGWEGLGAQITRTDSLGTAYTMNGFMAYVMLNNERRAAGDAVLSDAPAILTPGVLATQTLTLTAAAFSLAYTATPLPAATRLFVFASPQMSAGRSFNKDFRLINVSAAAAASPLNLLTAYTARLGVPVVGTRIFLMTHLYNAGWMGAPQLISQVVA